MQMIYNSPNYCVVEFPPQEGPLAMKSGGYEIVDKNMQRERAEAGRRGTVAR